jgi:hypothetical protein
MGDRHGAVITLAIAGCVGSRDLVEPGVVQVHRWRPGTGSLGERRDLAIYAGVARKRSLARTRGTPHNQRAG